MARTSSRERGFTLIETVVALGVLTVGLLGAASVLALGMQMIASSPSDLIATEKASEALESVVSARDTQTLTWAQIRNVRGATGADGGVFLDGPQPMRVAGNDGILGTADDGAVETVILPGPDETLGTADNQTLSLDGYTREIQIRDINTSLRSVTVIIHYRVGASDRTYTLSTYLSDYA